MTALCSQQLALESELAPGGRSDQRISLAISTYLTRHGNRLEFRNTKPLMGFLPLASFGTAREVSRRYERRNRENERRRLNRKAAA